MYFDINILNMTFKLSKCVFRSKKLEECLMGVSMDFKDVSSMFWKNFEGVEKVVPKVYHASFKFVLVKF